MSKGILWIRTRLEVTCNPNRFLVADIRKLADDGNGGIDFNIVVPQPQKYASVGEGKHVQPIFRGLYEYAEWRFEWWGANWNPVDAKWELLDDGFALTFDTADKCPLGWIEKFLERIEAEPSYGFKCAAGTFLPNKLGSMEYGSFVYADGIFTDYGVLECGFEDAPYMIKEAWGYDDEDLIAWRGLLHLPHNESRENESAKARFKKRWGFSKDEYERSLEAQVEMEVAEEIAEAQSERPHLNGFLGRLLGALDAWVASW